MSGDSTTASSTRVAQSSPSAALKIKFSVKGKGLPSSVDLGGSGTKRPSRAAARKSSKRTKMVAMDVDLGSDEDELDVMEEGDDPTDELDSGQNSAQRSTSPSKMTARQRARGNKDLQETLLELPHGNEGSSKKQLILTEAERIQRREEVARRRKRQTEQKLQDEQDQTINRLLRAQTGRSRAKLDVPSPGEEGGTGGGGSGVGGSRYPSPSRRTTTAAPLENMIRWISSIQDDNVVLRVAAPAGKEDWIAVSDATLAEDSTDTKPVLRRDARGTCGVDGCDAERKYRSVKKFETGGCSMEHLRAVEAGLA
ncbi:hypothetical protein BD324DRAFT_294568 [Kockovaella imperatae]|uniref:INO80 complex subunit B-like conserved region domain-containing protein n=1 Tax=Kockovaella imperatae TaxID=4999 RepID=A0A1Y1UMX1_9TREE|nr:hypothetical protein BD324DRAFT_294568 [Kockovaella imperatae]ORX38857.1 hypothetical protein BD324DRAFT_294568 [Kockovaella imperatae]